MSWEVSIKEEKGVKKYRIYSTVTDDWNTGWMNRSETIRHLFWFRLERFLNGFIKDSMTFPNGYLNHDSKSMKIISGEALEDSDYYKTVIKLSENDNYWKNLLTKFDEYAKPAGIEFNASDGEYSTEAKKNED